MGIDRAGYSQHTERGALIAESLDGTQAVGQAIERLSNPQILPILKQALEKTANKSLIHYVFPVIASIGGEEAIDVLKRFMQHKQPAVFEQAVGSLGDIPQPAACLALLDYAEGKTHALSRRNLAVSALPREHGLWDADRLIALMLSAEDAAEAIKGTAAAAHKRRTELYILAGSAAAVLAQTADTTVPLAGFNPDRHQGRDPLSIGRCAGRQIRLSQPHPDVDQFGA